MHDQANVTELSRLTMRSENYYESVNPFTEKVIETYPYDSYASLVEKLQLSDVAYQQWKALPLRKRTQPIRKFVSVLEKNKFQFAREMTHEMGKTYEQALAEIDHCIAITNFCLKNVSRALRQKKVQFEGGYAQIAYRPQGVVLSIQPWNFPFYQVIRYAIPNLLLGNTTLLKHSSCVWGAARRIESAFIEAGLPEGVFQLIYAKHEDLKDFYQRPEICGVTFTGSAEAGRKIAELAGANLKKTVLELGGNDAYIVTEEANLQKAVKACVEGRIINNGQTCTAAKRFIVTKSVYRDFKKMFVEAMKEVQIGDPMEKTTHLGPLARKDLLLKLKEQVEESLDLGAHCLAGGHVVNRTGFFFEPTVLENLEPGMPAYDDELFGPVASLIRAEDTEHALQIANSSRFGLGGGIFGDTPAVLPLALDKMESGMVNINGYTSSKAQLPFGGVKDSGYGRELGTYGFYEFANLKCVKIHN